MRRAGDALELARLLGMELARPEPIEERPELVELGEDLWEKFPHGWAKSIYVCFPNRLSRWTDICIRVRTVKREGELGVEAVTVDKMYRPEKMATYMIYLREPTDEEFERELERLKKEAEISE